MIVLQGARERVDILQFSPDGRLLVAPCEARVQVWNDLKSGGRPAALLMHSMVWAAQFTPNGQKLVLGHLGIFVHDLPTAEVVAVPYELQGLPYLTFGLSLDGLVLVVAESLFARDLPGRLVCRSLDAVASSVWSVDLARPASAPPLFLQGGDRFVLFEGWPDRVPFWYVTRDASTGQLLAEVMGSGRQHHRPVQSADRALVAARSGVWAVVFRADDFGAGPVAELRNDNRKELTGLAFHPSGRFLAATSNDATVKLYDTVSWKMVQAFNWDIGRLRSIAFSPDGMLAAAGGDKGKIVVWDMDL
jgi:WD40 repeat protein